MTKQYLSKWMPLSGKLLSGKYFESMKKQK